VNMPILGLVENMSGMVCPHCGESIEFLKHGGGSDLAAKTGLRLLAGIPFTQNVVQAGDNGIPDTTPFASMVQAVIEQSETSTDEG
jgi:ATP-binding protein involved in chromosome partitioning